MKRGYFVKVKEGDEGIAVVASSVGEAKKIAFTELRSDCEWIEIVATWRKNADVECFDVGIVQDGINALHHGLYDDYYSTCDGCCGDSKLVSHKGKALCGWCVDNDVIPDIAIDSQEEYHPEPPY